MNIKDTTAPSHYRHIAKSHCQVTAVTSKAKIPIHFSMRPSPLERLFIAFYYNVICFLLRCRQLSIPTVPEMMALPTSVVPVQVSMVFSFVLL